MIHYLLVKIETPDEPTYSPSYRYRYPLSPEAAVSAVFNDGLDGDNYYKAVTRAIAIVIGNPTVRQLLDEIDLQPLATNTMENQG